jgi:hypothetical protein
MSKIANSLPVTTALKTIVKNLKYVSAESYLWTFSDPRKVKGFRKSVAVKICKEYLTEEQRKEVIARMVELGYIYITDSVRDYRRNRLHYYKPIGGTRFTFAQPKYKV